MRDGIDEFGETAPDQADLTAVKEAREAWALTRSHGASDDPLSPTTVNSRLRRLARDLAALGTRAFDSPDPTSAHMLE